MLENAPDAPKLTGVIKRFFPDKGYGFIHRDDRDEDLFVHFLELPPTCVNADKRRTLPKGCRVTFQIGEDREKRPTAIRVRPVDSESGTTGTYKRPGDRRAIE
jgi:cold shock CspA family protein